MTEHKLLSISKHATLIQLVYGGLLLRGGKGKGRERRKGEGGEEIREGQGTKENGREAIGMPGKGE